MSQTNDIVTSVSALNVYNNITTISDNNIVCIDMEYGRIGVNTSSPRHEIDVSGTITSKNILPVLKIFSCFFQFVTNEKYSSFKK